MLNFGLEASSEGGSALLAVRGDFDVQVAERVAQELARIEATQPELLVVDLSRLSFLDSSGMAVIAAAYGRAGKAERRFAVVNPPPGVRRAFEMSGLDEVIVVANELAEVYP